MKRFGFEFLFPSVLTRHLIFASKLKCVSDFIKKIHFNKAEVKKVTNASCDSSLR